MFFYLILNAKLHQINKNKRILLNMIKKELVRIEITSHS